MTLAELGWLFTLGVLVHNAEEAVWLPAWSVQAGRWHAPVGAGEFRFAVGVLTLFFVLAAAGASMGGAGSFPAYLMAGCVLTMVLNVVFPHLLATVFMRKYMPGTATALLLTLPLGSLYLKEAITGHHIDPGVFVWAGPLTAVLVAASLPLLFMLGRKIFGSARQRP